MEPLECLYQVNLSDDFKTKVWGKNLKPFLAGPEPCSLVNWGFL